MNTLARHEKLSPPRSYEELRDRVRETLEGGRLRAREILQRIQSEMFWQTGRWIHLYLKYEKKTQGRAPYGEKVVVRLAGELNHDKGFLYDAWRVYQKYPIFRTFRKLPVSHHRALLRVKDEAQRKALAAEAEKEGWSSHELVRRIRESRSLRDGRKSIPGLRPRKGKLHHYQIVERRGRLLVDLGFRDFREIREPDSSARPPVRFKDGDIVEGTSLDKLTQKPEATRADLYTYGAEVLELLDADTYWLFIAKGFASYREDKIRLRGIDCPEISTPQGREAKKFVESLLRDETSSSGYLPVLLTTTKTPDKWDRYLADVCVEKDGQEIYLNGLLLEKNFAVLYED